MPFSVTSWFVQQCALANPNVKRQLTIGGSDYTRYVDKWPSVAKVWDDPRPVSVTISLANEEQTFNFFKTDKTKLRSAAQLKIGFTHPTSGDEMILIHAGTTERVSYQDGKADIAITDKLKQLSERIVGTSNSPAVFSSSTLLFSDMAWTLCTCYGGYSSVASTSNPDIDYQSWLNWAAVMSADSVFVGGRFEGAKVTEALRKIARHSQSAITLLNDKLTFYRFTTVNTNISSLDSRHIKSLQVTIDDVDMTNKQWVYADYRVQSDYWAISVFDTKSASVNSFGLRENIEKDESVWYVSSANALSLAQRVMNTSGVPYDRLHVKTPLMPVFQYIGDTVIVVDPHLGVTEGWRIMGSKIDFESGQCDLTIDNSQVNSPFVLDVSALDGGDLLL